MFPSSSHGVLIKFSKCQSVLKYIPQDVPNSISDLSHMFCPKFSSHVYKLNKWIEREYFCFYFPIGVQRGSSIGYAQCSKKIDDGPITMGTLKINIKSYDCNYNNKVTISNYT